MAAVRGASLFGDVAKRRHRLALEQRNGTSGPVRIPRMTGLFRDSTIAARTLLKARAFTAVCVTSLGLGMAVVIAMLLLMRMLLSTPPGVNEDRLVDSSFARAGPCAHRRAAMSSTPGRTRTTSISAPRSAAWIIAGWSRGDGLFRPPDRSAAVPLATVYVSSNYFQTWASRSPSDAGSRRRTMSDAAEPEAVISHRVWEVRFGSDPNIIGRTLTSTRPTTPSSASPQKASVDT